MFSLRKGRAFCNVLILHKKEWERMGTGPVVFGGSRTFELRIFS
jgi:hypothetical protein